MSDCPVPTCMDLFHVTTSCFGDNNYCPRCGKTYKSYNATNEAKGQGMVTMEYAHLWQRMGSTEYCVKCPATREATKFADGEAS